MIKQQKNQTFLVFLVAFLVLFYFYGDVIANLNSVVFSGKGDGLKNYYTYLFHAKYDTNFWNFTGMNYPFYEHIVYTDAHPLLSFLIGKLGLTNYGIGILNFLMLISYPVSAVFIHKILKYYKVNDRWAIISSIIFCFLSPQVFRLTGHLSLSYVFAIPLMWWFLIKVETTRKVIWSGLIFVLLFGFFFTHPYLGLILAIFGLVYALVFFVFKRKDWLFYGVKIVLPILISIGIFQFIVGITDHHVDRMKTPAGFYEYYAKWNSLVVSHHGPMNWLKHKLNFRMSGWESWSYIGLTTIVILIFSLIYYIVKRKDLSLKGIFSTPLGKVYLAAHLVLLFSFCFPLKYDFMRPVVEALGPLKQFRVLGRFAWVYFYVATIASIAILVYVKSKSKKSKFGWELILYGIFLLIVFMGYPWYVGLISTAVFLILLWLISRFAEGNRWDLLFYSGMLILISEFYSVHTGVSTSISETKNPFKVENLSDDLKAVIEWSKDKGYDAIIFLPFVHLSSENTFILGSEEGNADAMKLSFHTQTPLLNTITSRTSVAESVLYQNLFSPEFIDKELTDRIGSDKKIMLIKNKDALNFNELRMIWVFDEIFENDTYTIYNFSLDQWNTPEYFNDLVKRKEKATILLNDGWYSNTSEVNYLYDSFDELEEVNSMAGSGALAARKEGIFMIKPEIKGLETGQYICSFWYNMRIDRANQLAVIEQEFVGDSAKWVAQNSIRETNLIVGDWAYVEMEFEITDTVENTKLFLSWNDSKQWLIVDELLIRKVGDNALFKTEKLKDEEYIIYNNYWMKANSFSE